MLKTVYSGSHYAGPELRDDGLRRARARRDASRDGRLRVGHRRESATRTVTLTNSGTAALHVSSAAVKGEGPFSITADGCAEKTLAAGETCDVTVAFGPGAAGAFSAKLGVSHDGDGASSVALTGTGAVAPAPPVPPAPTPTPPPAQPGGTLAPGAKPTLTVSVPSGSGARASSAPVLSLPLELPGQRGVPARRQPQDRDVDALAAWPARRRPRRRPWRASRACRSRPAGLKTIKLKLSPAFVKSAQKRGIRRIKATLTINTVLGSGERTTTQQQVTVLIPKAAKKKQAAPKVRPRFTG